MNNINYSKEAVEAMLKKERERFEVFMKAKGFSEHKLRRNPLFHWYLDEEVARYWFGWCEKAVYDFNTQQASFYIDPEDIKKLNSTDSNGVPVHIFKSGSLLMPVFVKEQ